MCTVSWHAGGDGYELLFNRDERHTRAPESAPEFGRCDGVAYLAPRDGDHGGTWLLANERGLTVCLLNDYGASWRPPSDRPRSSRGHAVLACAGAAKLADVEATIRAQPLAATPAFRLLALSPVEAPLLLHWRGDRLDVRRGAEVVAPLSSSSFATEAVISRRVARFGDFVRAPAAPEMAELAAFHRQHDAAAGAFSVLMRRDDAATRSVIHVSVDARHVRLDYRAVAWTAGGPVLAEPLRARLDRRGGAALAA